MAGGPAARPSPVSGWPPPAGRRPPPSTPRRALTASPDWSGPRGCASPGAGCDCCEGACVGSKDVSDWAPTAPAGGAGRADGGLSGEVEAEAQTDDPHAQALGLRRQNDDPSLTVGVTLPKAGRSTGCAALTSCPRPQLTGLPRPSDGGLLSAGAGRGSGCGFLCGPAPGPSLPDLVVRRPYGSQRPSAADNA